VTERRPGLSGAAAALVGLLDRPLIIVDAGMRWGAPSQWSWFGTAHQVIGFEPEPLEAAELAATYRDDPTVRVVAGALGRTEEIATLHITADASGSSLFTPVVSPRFGPVEVVDTAEVAVMALDGWRIDHEAPAIDAIKLDVQGGELAIVEGAVTTLADVRALITEVAFNPIYDDAPLFGEIDAFLRLQGFELWSLPTMAQYSPPGVPTVADGLAVAWSDSVPAPLVGPASQLIWTDALYVRRDLAVEGTERTWREHVRDACVMIGFEVAGLAHRSLSLARTIAPEWAQPAISDGLLSLEEHRPIDAYRRSRADVLAERSTPLTGAVTLDLAAPLEGWGWHEPQRLGGGWIRWTGPQRESALDLPLRCPAGTTIEIGLAGAAAAELLAELEIDLDGRRLATELQAIDGILTACAVATHPVRRGFTRLVLRVPATIPWRDVVTGSEDWTEHGICVSSVTLRPPA